MQPLIFYLTTNGNLVTFVGDQALVFNTNYQLLSQKEKFELHFLKEVAPMVTFLHLGNLEACEGGGYIYIRGIQYFQDQTSKIWGKCLSLDTNDAKYRLQIRKRMVVVNDHTDGLCIEKTNRHTRGMLRTGIISGRGGRTTLLRFT